eukprot:1404817-Amphidinium_carterae.1
MGDHAPLHACRSPKQKLKAAAANCTKHTHTHCGLTTSSDLLRAEFAGFAIAAGPISPTMIQADGASSWHRLDPLH